MGYKTVRGQLTFCGSATQWIQNISLIESSKIFLDIEWFKGSVLAEASAKSRMSKQVEVRDAKLAVRFVRFRGVY